MRGIYLKILIVDGQGGGIGKALIERMKNKLPSNCQLMAAGTNAAATAAMMRAGAVQAVTGENAIIFNVNRADVIAGSIGIISANAMMGELSPKIAEAISSSNALKILIPLNRCQLQVVGVMTDSLPQMLEEAVNRILDFVSK